jgi:hypothetical protein
MLSRIYFEDFFQTLNNEQEIAMALGSGWFDSTSLAQLTRTHWVSVFLNMAGENRGFVSPAEVGFISVNLGGAHIGIPTTADALKKHFGLVSLTNSEIDQLIRSFCHFLALSVKHNHQNRSSEGFLHSVIGVDLLLGEKLESSKTIVRRSAVLSYFPRNRPFAQAVRDCDMIYDARSKYVHAGQIPDVSLFDLSIRVCREIVFCLLRLRRNSEAHRSGFRERWVREIDLIAAMCEAGRPPSTDDLSRIGVGLEGEYGLERLQKDLLTPNMANESE